MSNAGQFGQRDYDVKTRRPRGKSKRTMMLEALYGEVVDELGDQFESPEAAEAAYMRLLVRRSMTLADKASGMLAKEIMDRLCPADKSTMPVYQVDMPEDGTAADKIRAVTAAVAAGEVPPDVGNMMVNMITAAVKVEEVVEMSERLAKLEQLLADLEQA